MEHLAGPLIIIAILAFFALMIKWTGMGKYAEAQRMFETQKQIIDKLGSGPEMIQFIGSKEGREFFERLKAPPSAATRTRTPKLPSGLDRRHRFFLCRYWSGSPRCSPFLSESRTFHVWLCRNLRRNRNGRRRWDRVRLLQETGVKPTSSGGEAGREGVIPWLARPLTGSMSPAPRVRQFLVLPRQRSWMRLRFAVSMTGQPAPCGRTCGC